MLTKAFDIDWRVKLHWNNVDFILGWIFPFASTVLDLAPCQHVCGYSPAGTQLQIFIITLTANYFSDS